MNHGYVDDRTQMWLIRNEGAKTGASAPRQGGAHEAMAHGDGGARGVVAAACTAGGDSATPSAIDTG